MPEPQWVRTDEWADVVGSIEHMTGCLVATPERMQEWKWAIIACHSAAQGALVCVLSGTDSTGALSNKSREAVYAGFEASRSKEVARLPDPFLASFMELVDRAFDAEAMSVFGGRALAADLELRNDLESLNELRKQFVHFTPVGWSIEITGLPHVIAAATRFVWRLIFGHPASYRRLDDRQIELFARHFQGASQVLESMGAQGFPLMVPKELRLDAQRAEE